MPAAQSTGWRARAGEGGITLVIAVVAALASAFFNALAAFLEQGATKRLGGDQGGPLAQMWALLKQPRWLAGQGSDVTAFLVQAVALGFGALILVEPLLVMSLPFAVALRAAIRHQPPRLRGVLGSALCVAGVSLFLVVARPTPGNGPVTWAQIWPTAIGLGVAVGVSFVAAARTRGNWQAVAYAFAAASFYAVTAASMRVVTMRLGHGILAVLTHWSLYVVIGCGITGVILVQQALKAGALAAPVAVITVGDPLLSIVLGIVWLGESITTSAPAMAAEVAGIAAVVGGVVVLAGQSTGAAAGTRADPAGEQDGPAAPGGRRETPGVVHGARG